MKTDFMNTQDISLVFILNTLIGNETNHVVLIDVSIEHAFEYPVILSGLNETTNADPFWDGKPDVYVLNSTTSNLGNVMRRIGNSFNYNPCAKFILLHGSEDINNTEELSRYFISTVYVIRDKHRYFGEITSADSDNLTGCSINTEESINYSVQQYLGRWNNSGFTICFIDESVPPYSLYTVCPNCSRNSGLGFDTADMALQRLNITRLQLALNGDDLSSESLKNWLTSGTCDMVLTPPIIVDGLLDFIFPINDDELIWFVPSPLKMPKWKYVTKVFSFRIWFIWTLTISFAALFWFIGRGINLNESTLPLNSIEPRQIITKLLIFSLQKMVFITQLFLEQGTAPSGKYLFQITFMVIVIIPTVVFNMMYKTVFTSMLLGPDIFEDRITSLEDVVDHELSVSFAEWRLAAFDGTSAKVKNYFISHNTPCETIAFCLKRMRTSRDLALLMSIENIKYDFEKFLDENGHPVIAPIYPRFVKPLYGSILLRGNPMAEIMIKYNTLLRDHGFIAVILSRYNRRHPTLRDVDEDKQLTIENLWGPFFILLFGILIGFISFLSELTLHFLNRRTEIKCLNNGSSFRDDFEIS